MTRAGISVVVAACIWADNVTVACGTNISAGVTLAITDRGVGGAGVRLLRDGVMVASSVAMNVGMFVGDDVSRSVNVGVDVNVGPWSGWGVIVIVGSAAEVSIELVDSVGEAGANAVGVGVLQGPCVLRARYCGHSSSLILSCRSPPGRLSQIVRFWSCDVVFCGGWRTGEVGVNADGTGVEVDATDDACGNDVAVAVGDTEVVTVVCAVSEGAVVVTEGDGVIPGVKVDVKDGVTRGDELDVAVGVSVGVGVIDGLDVEVGVKSGFGVGVRVCSVAGHPPSGAGIKSSSCPRCACTALGLVNVSSV